MITELKNVKKIYFFDNGYGVRGGANFMLEIIKFLLDNSIIPVGLIDFKDGYMRESLIDRNIDFVDYEDLESLKTIEIGDRVFMGSDDQWCQVDLISLS